MGRGKQAAGQSRAPGRVMWTSSLPRDSVQPMKAALRNSNEIIRKHRKLCWQVPGDVSSESGPSIEMLITYKLCAPVYHWITFF